MHLIFLGILLGWGAAIPIGPINLEIIRRNLSVSTSAGIAFGLGACSADVTYLLLLSMGALIILNNPTLLKTVGILGSFILFWFGYTALRTKSSEKSHNNAPTTSSTTSLIKHLSASYFMTLLNPITIIFWSSVSAQIALLAHTKNKAGIGMGIGVMLGAISWTLFLNALLHFTRHKFSARTMRIVNIVGGMILLIFGGLSLWHALKI